MQSSQASRDAKDRCTTEHTHTHVQAHTGESTAGSHLRVTDVERKHLEGKESIRKRQQKTDPHRGHA